MDVDTVLGIIGSTTGVAALVWHVIAHFRAPEQELAKRTAVRRDEEQREALRIVRSAIGAVTDICGAFIEQFPKGTPPHLLHIGPAKVANRLAVFHRTWKENEQRIGARSVREAYAQVGIERVLRLLGRTPPDQAGAVVEDVQGLRASLDALGGEIEEVVR